MTKASKTGLQIGGETDHLKPFNYWEKRWKLHLLSISETVSYFPFDLGGWEGAPNPTAG